MEREAEIDTNGVNVVENMPVQIIVNGKNVVYIGRRNREMLKRMFAVPYSPWRLRRSSIGSYGWFRLVCF